MDLLVYAVAVLLLGSVVLFIKVALFNRRPQKTGLLFALLSLPLYAIYYADHWPWGSLPILRQSIEWLQNFGGADAAFKANTAFVSDPAPAFLVAGILLVHMTVVQRVAAGKRLERIQDPIANFFASTLVVSLAGGIVVSTFSLGWVGSIIVGVAYTLVYLGVLALLAAVVEVLVELAKLLLVWLKRWAFLIATWITRISSFVSSLAGRLGLTSLADRIRAQRGEQELVFVTEQDRQDKELYEAFLRDRAKQRRMSGRTEQQVQDEIAELSAPEAEPITTPAAAAAAPAASA